MGKLPLRIFRSFRAKYYEDDILQGPAAYPEEYFAELVHNGFNAVWLRGILRDLAPSTIFPTLGSDIGRHHDALATVVERAARHGVKVLLYLNEPLCLPQDHAFWTEHPEVRGASGDSLADGWPKSYTFCTSTPQVRQFLRETSARLFKDIPELGGWFLITAGEHHTHCYSHIPKAFAGERPDCPLCAKRAPVDVVADLIADLRDGTRQSSPTAELIAWNWAWHQYIEPDPQPTLLSRLPKDVRVLIDWERGGWRTMPNGRRNFIDEYSLSYIGPSERFEATHKEALRHGLATMAKLQIGTTHELATVPNLPLVDNLYEKLCRVEERGLRGILATWNFGNMFTLNTAAVGRFVRISGIGSGVSGIGSKTAETRNPKPETRNPRPQQFVADLAAEYFPGCDAAGVARAVAQFTAAMQHYPFDMMLVYHGPMNYVLAYPLSSEPLTGKPMGWNWMMHERGDDPTAAPTSSLGQFTLEEVIAAFDEVVRQWRLATDTFAAALAPCKEERAQLELGVARTIGCCYRSTANFYKTYKLRKERPADLDAQFAAIAADEITNLEQALPLLKADPRLGFHAECQGQMFAAESVEAKLRSLRQHLAPAGSTPR